MAHDEFVVDEVLVAEAYQRIEPEFAALKAEEVETPTLDIHAAVRTVLGALPEIRDLRAQLVKELPAFDVAAFDKLEDYALALSRAHARYQIATTSPNELDEVIVEASKARERLVAAARGLALFGLFDGRKLDQLKHGNGHSNVAEDLQALSAAFEENWTKLEGKTPLTLESVKGASRLALRFTRLVGLKEQGTPEQAEATDLRRRAFTLLLRTYEDVRAAVRFLRRREDDADSIVPTLYVKTRRASGKDETQVPEGTVATPATGVPVATPAARGGGGAGAGADGGD